MAKLTKAEVLHVAKLAKLQLSKKEEEKYQKQLSSVIDFIGELNEVNTSNLEPTSQTTGLVNVYRTDEVVQSKTLKVEEAVSGTETIHNGYFKVPAILNKSSEK